MRNLFFSCALLLSVSVVAQTPSLTKKEQKQGWKLLFDGKSFAGWHKYNGKEVGSAWMVHDGAMMLLGKKDRAGKTAGDLITDENLKITNFLLNGK